MSRCRPYVRVVLNSTVDVEELAGWVEGVAAAGGGGMGPTEVVRAWAWHTLPAAYATASNAF